MIKKWPTKYSIVIVPLPGCKISAAKSIWRVTVREVVEFPVESFVPLGPLSPSKSYIVGKNYSYNSLRNWKIFGEKKGLPIMQTTERINKQQLGLFAY